MPLAPYPALRPYSHMTQTHSPILISENKVHGGTQTVYSHYSEACDCKMKLGVFLPPRTNTPSPKLPVLIFLSGLTCTEQNFITKAGAQALAAELGLIIVAPDTSPRGDEVVDDAAYDLGQGAGFYVDATQAPWEPHFQMESYIRDDLMSWIAAHIPAADMSRVGISGHSMGGHGALTLHLKNPNLFKTCSAFAPITAPMNVPWGQKALGAYLGENNAFWARYDACALVKTMSTEAHILIDQGSEDQFLTEQLRPHLFQTACELGGQDLTLRMQPGYDHSYYFITSFIDDHLRWHAERL